MTVKQKSYYTLNLSEELAFQYLTHFSFANAEYQHGNESLHFSLPAMLADYSFTFHHMGVFI